MSPERRISGKRIEQSPIDKRFFDKNNQEGKGKNQPDLSIVGEGRIFEQDQKEKEMRHNSKSVESVDGGRDLHEVLKPKGIEIYSSNHLQNQSAN